MFWNRNKQDVKRAPESENSLYPVLHVMGSLKDYHTELVQKEVDSLRELDNIGGSDQSLKARIGISHSLFLSVH